MKRSVAIALGLLALTMLTGSGVACGAHDAESDSAAADITAGGDCQMFVVKDQKFVDLKSFVSDPSRKNDQVAQKILRPVVEGKAPCPSTYIEIQKSPGLQTCTRTLTQIVSERSTLLGKPDLGRAVVNRSCKDEFAPELLFLLDPIRADKDIIPPDVELMSNDTADGIFSYYAREPEAGPRDPFNPKEDMKKPAIWKFYGTSVDFVTNGYDCDPKKFHGACQSKFAQDGNGNASGVRCASCHPGGGMVMKELASPWTYWQNDLSEYVHRHEAEFGGFQRGTDFQPLTEIQNDRWSKTRVEVLAKKSVTELLRPLFCTIEMNLQSGEGFVRKSFLADRHLVVKPNEGSQLVPLDPANYAKAIAAVKQVIKASPALPGGKSFADTPDPFLVPERSGLDLAYVDALVESKKVSDELIRDILFVDFTRPIFSPTRCALAVLADGITDPKKAKEELVRKLAAKSSRSAGEEEFLASLKATGPAPRHAADVESYFNACVARGKSDNAGLTTDMVKYASHLWQVTKLLRVKLKVERTELGILDFAETVPVNDLSTGPVKEMKFDPKTCALAEE